MSKIITKEIDLDGRKLKLETGLLAHQTEAAVLASWGDTVVLVTVATKPTTEALDHFPLSVEFVEKYYAGGRITAQRFIKREARPSEKAVLSGRAIDRAIRPLFPKDFHHEVQIIVTVLSFDGVNDPLILGFIGTAAALTISSIPWVGPMGVARVGVSNDSLVFNPDLPSLERVELDLLVAATKDKVVMVEAEGKEVADETVFEAIKSAHQHSQPIIDLLEEFAKEAGKEKQPYQLVHEQIEEKLLKEVKDTVKQRMEEALSDRSSRWHESTGDLIKQALGEKYAESLSSQQVSVIFDKVAKEVVNEMILNKGERVDGRGMEELRPITAKVGVLPRTHGSALFQRGDTQVLSVVTLGPLSASQTLEGMEGEAMKRFMHHYNMSINPFATGEVKRIGAPNRRDIGHGSLVEKGLEYVLPSEEDFPYAMRAVSEVLAANASTSMASVCASTLALLNAGVPLTEPAAGVALGLVSDGQKFQVITDMQAIEDFYGEMDFKVTGTRGGITAIQMDTKLPGLTFDVIQEALRQGKLARELILEEMIKVMPKEIKLSEYAPKIEVTHIKPENIGILIGPGGRNINSIIAKTGAQIDIEDDGTVMISSMDVEAVRKALAAVEGMFKTVEVGEEYDGKVVNIVPFGAFVEILPGKDGLLHISKLAPHRVERVEDVLEMGQMVHVKVTEVTADGKINLSLIFGDGEQGEGGRHEFGRDSQPSIRSRRDRRY